MRFFISVATDGDRCNADKKPQCTFCDATRMTRKTAVAGALRSRTAAGHPPPSWGALVVPDYITHARGYSEQPAPASGCQGMSCLLLGGRAAIRSTSGPLAALVLLAIRSSELALQLFKATLKLLQLTCAVLPPRDAQDQGSAPLCRFLHEILFRTDYSA